MSEEAKPEAPQRLLLVAGIGLLAACGVAAYFVFRSPCPCKKHTTGEEPLVKVAQASAALAEEGGTTGVSAPVLPTATEERDAGPPDPLPAPVVRPSFGEPVIPLTPPEADGA